MEARRSGSNRGSQPSRLAGRLRRPPTWWLLAPILTCAMAWFQFIYDWRAERHVHLVYTLLLVVLSIMIGLLLHGIVGVRSRESRQAERYLHELEGLQQMSSEASSKLGEGQAALKGLVKAICELLAFDEAVVALKDERDPTLHFISTYGLVINRHGQRIPLDDMQLVKRCLATRQLITVEDIARTHEPINKLMAQEEGLKSTVVVPLIITDRAIGVLILGNRRPRSFEASELRLASLWGAQAAAVITSNNLFERARRSLANRKTLQKRLDSVHNLLTTLYRTDNLQASLQGMVDALPTALDIDSCTISVVSEQRNALTILAVTQGTYPDHIVGMRIPRENIPFSWGVLDSGKMAVIEDAANTPELNGRIRVIMKVGSVIFIPLYSSDTRPIGLLSLIRTQPRSFSEEVRELADLLARRAADAMESAMLYQQIRRDAETKTMLLRELNHRVKNNLAGIVGLLSLEQPELPPLARQWLDRAIGRIQMMARTHDLFGVGTTQVDLRTMVEMLLQSLAVVCPPRARMQTELGSIEVALQPQRAVSLVMVLHELCYNALSYGIGPGGEMRICARGIEGHRVAIDVIDDGSADPRPARSDDASELRRSSGLGLTLVRELVQTELHGIFTSEKRPTGGTIATVEFPLEVRETELIPI